MFSSSGGSSLKVPWEQFHSFCRAACGQQTGSAQATAAATAAAAAAAAAPNAKTRERSSSTGLGSNSSSEGNRSNDTRSGGNTRQGWLVKRGGKRKNWKRRFFVLRANVLFYCENAGDPASALGLLFLEQCTFGPMEEHPQQLQLADTAAGGAASRARSASTSPTSGTFEGRPFVFYVTTIDGRHYFLSAESAADREEWLQVLRQSQMGAMHTQLASETAEVSRLTRQAAQLRGRVEQAEAHNRALQQEAQQSRTAHALSIASIEKAYEGRQEALKSSQKSWQEVNRILQDENKVLRDRLSRMEAGHDLLTRMHVRSHAHTKILAELSRSVGRLSENASLSNGSNALLHNLMGAMVGGDQASGHLDKQAAPLAGAAVGNWSVEEAVDALVNSAASRRTSSGSLAHESSFDNSTFLHSPNSLQALTSPGGNDASAVAVPEAGAGGGATTPTAHQRLTQNTSPGFSNGCDAMTTHGPPALPPVRNFGAASGNQQSGMLDMPHLARSVSEGAALEMMLQKPARPLPPLPSTPRANFNRVVQADHSEGGAADHGVMGAKIWVGTWNVQFTDPLAGVRDAGEKSYVLEEFVPAGYDIYVLGVQEGTNDGLFEAVGIRLAGLGLQRLQLRSRRGGGVVADRVSGRGDGAYFSTKFTGVACFVRRTLLSNGSVSLHEAAAVGEGFSSKGAVAFVLSVFGATVCFVNCHLEAFDPPKRLRQFRMLVQKLGENLGNDSCRKSRLGLIGQFHQTVWLGDLNYRIAGLTGEQVLAMLANTRSMRRCYAEHDSLRRDQAAGLAFSGFREPRMVDTFFPTYKKYTHRPRVSDYSDPSWLAATYKIAHKEPFYKGGAINDRVPGWCDRVLWYPNDSHSVLEPLMASEFATDDQFSLQVRGPDGAGPIVAHEYRAMNDGPVMSVSDHSPVYAGFRLLSHRSAGSVPATTGVREPLAGFVYITISLGKLAVRCPGGGDYDWLGHVRDTHVVFPAPYEDCGAGDTGLAATGGVGSVSKTRASMAARSHSESSAMLPPALSASLRQRAESGDPVAKTDGGDGSEVSGSRSGSGSVSHGVAPRCFSEQKCIDAEDLGLDVCCKLTWKTRQPASQLHLLVSVTFDHREDEKPVQAQACIPLFGLRSGVQSALEAPLLMDGLPIRSSSVSANTFSFGPSATEGEDVGVKQSSGASTSSISNTQPPAQTPAYTANKTGSTTQRGVVLTGTILLSAFQT